MKKPRQYADDIMKLDTREERLKYLETRVPKEFRDVVRKHVEIAYDRKKSIRMRRKNRP